MKRFLVALLAGIVMFAASGCGGGESKPADAKPGDAAAAPAAGEKAPAEPAK